MAGMKEEGVVGPASEPLVGGLFLDDNIGDCLDEVPEQGTCFRFLASVAE
ncbi:MAG: hypothetical protein OXD44_04255 [Gammaproteobacteria bacterium]|nr:hypothetical protein [Gammaproteobacteria bacterium]MCY4228092.1 hypothetical protein [Gammaproteobacteria bacterium]MCY4312903.1 hypothetical protein [Gammaproteobacteria bacterium]